MPAERPPQHVVLAQDGEQSAKGCCRQGECHRYERLDVPGCLEDADDGEGESDRDSPGTQGQAAWPLPQEQWRELVAGEQEEEAETDVGQQGELTAIGPSQDLRTDQDATDEQEYHLGDSNR